MIWYVQKALGDCNKTILSASSYWNIFVTDTCFVLLLRLAALACRPHCHIPVRLENGKIIYIEDWGRGFFGSGAQTLTPLATPRKPNISDSPKNQASRRKWRKGWVLVVFDWTLIEHEFSWESEYDPKVFLDCLVLLSEGKQPTRPSKHPHHYFVFDDFPTDTTSGFTPQGRRPLISDAAGIEKNDLTVFWEGEHPPHLSAR